MDSNLRKVKNAMRIIELFDLTSKTRKRDTVYKRCYIMAKLRQLGCTFEMIGELFDKDHSSVVYSVNTHNYFTKVSDLPYRLAIEPVKEKYKNMNQQMQSNIYDDVLTSQDFNDLLLIKEKIHMGLYN